MPSLLHELFANLFRHKVRFVVLVASLGLATLALYFVLTALRTSRLISQPSLPAGVVLLGLEMGDAAQLPGAAWVTQTLGLSGVPVSVKRVMNTQGIAIRAYIFADLETLQREYSAFALQSGSLPRQGEVMLPSEACDLLRCKVGSVVQLGANRTVLESYRVSGIIRSSTPTTAFGVNRAASKDPLTLDMWLRSDERSVDGLRDTVKAALQKNGVQPRVLSVIDRVGEQRSFQRLFFAFAAIFGPVALIALFSAGLLVVFNFAVNRVERAKEAAIKRALGASTAQVTGESLAEAVLVFVLAFLPSFLIGFLLLDVANRRLGNDAIQSLFYPDLNQGLITGAIVLSLVLLAAIGPSWMLAREHPSLRLKEE